MAVQVRGFSKQQYLACLAKLVGIISQSYGYFAQEIPRASAAP